MSFLMSLFKDVKPVSTIAEPPPTTDPNTPPPILVQRLDFAAMGLPEYEHCFAMVIDNLFSEVECQTLLDTALASKKDEEGKWEVAQINAGGGRQVTATDYRNSGRIVLDNQDIADGILEKVRPYLQEIEVIKDADLHQLYSSPRQKIPRDAKIVRLNEQMKFLRYESGQFFKEHCDGTYYTPDRKDISYHTLQLYLNGDKDSIKGGSTRIWTQQRSSYMSKKGPKKAKVDHIDVFPRRGRVFIFEQGTILHSGEKVTGKGVKYSMRTDLMYRQDEETEPVAAA